MSATSAMRGLLTRRSFDRCFAFGYVQIAGDRPAIFNEIQTDCRLGSNMTTPSNSDIEHLQVAINLAASTETRGNRAYGAVIIAADGAVVGSGEDLTPV